MNLPHVYRLAERVVVLDAKEQMHPAIIVGLVAWNDDGTKPADAKAACSALIASEGFVAPALAAHSARVLGLDGVANNYLPQSRPPEGARWLDLAAADTPHTYAIVVIVPDDGLGMPLQAVYALAELLHRTPTSRFLSDESRDVGDCICAVPALPSSEHPPACPVYQRWAASLPAPGVPRQLLATLRIMLGCEHRDDLSMLGHTPGGVPINVCRCCGRVLVGNAAGDDHEVIEPDSFASIRFALEPPRRGS